MTPLHGFLWLMGLAVYVAGIELSIWWIESNRERSRPWFRLPPSVRFFAALLWPLTTLIALRAQWRR